MPRALLLLACLLLPAGVAYATPALRFQLLTIEDGLAQNSVTAITQDATGYLWFGSQDGLNRYDGHRFTIFKNDPNDARSIPVNYVTALLPGEDGDVWVGTRFGGLALFDAATETFARVPLAYGEATDTRFVVHRLAHYRGELWAALDRGLARYDAAARALRLQPLPGVQAFPDVRALHAAGDSLWIGVVGRVLRYDGAFETLRLPDAAVAVHALLEDIDGSLLVATSRGAYRHAGARFDVVRGLPPLVYVRLARDSDGGAWAGSRNGLFHRARADAEWQRYDHAGANARNLTENLVFDIFESRDRVLWIGTYGGGLSRAALSQRRFGLQQAREGGLNSNIVFPIHEDASGVVWIGTYSDGLNRWDRARDEWRHYVHDPRDPGSLSNNEVRALYTEADGTLWVGTNAGGLSRLDPRASSFVHYRHDPRDPGSIAGDGVTAILVDSRERFWVGTWGRGLDLFDPASGRFTHFAADPADPRALSDNWISDIVEGPDGLLWIGTEGGGVNRFDPASGEFTSWRHDDDDPGSLADDSINSLWFDANGVLWIGTANGLDRMDVRDGSIRHYRERDGLANNLVLGIVGDSAGDLWISTNRGLSRYSPDDDAFITYHQADGLQSDEFNSFAYGRNDKGELFFGGIGGFNVFDPAAIVPDSTPPAVRIAGMTLFNQPVLPDADDPDAILRGPAERADTVTLRHEQNLFTVEFAALGFTDPARNAFAYRLRGFSDEWIRTGAAQPFATYTNLDPGSYTFEVIAANPDGHWSEQPARLGITVLPPWWRTGFAYAVYALILAAVAWLTVQYQKKRIEVRFLAREKTAAEEATRLKSSFLALMSHEIRTPMNGVLGMVQLLARTRLSRRQRGYVEALEKSGESLLTILDDVLDFSRIEADVIEFESIPFDPREVAESVVLLLGPRAREKGIALSFRAEALPAAVTGDPTRLRQVLMNLVSNAIKFTPAGGVKVRAAQQPAGEQRVRLTFAVEDTGIGISAAQQSKLFEAFVQADTSTRRTHGGAGLGLSICKRLVEMQGGDIGLESEPGAGSVFWFELEYELAEAPPRVEAVAMRPGRVLRVLLVEDQPVNQEVARGLLEHEGHAVSVAPDGQTALKLISEREYDVVLMDIHMPGIDGREATRRIRALDDPVKASIPVLGLTASISADDVAACLNAGMNKVLRKPLPAARLVQALAQLDEDSEVEETREQEKRLVDAGMLAQHRAALGEQRFHDIVATFCQTSAALVDAIEAAAQAGDERAVRRDAHRLAGAASSMGCDKLADAATRVEQGLAEAEMLRSLQRQTEHALRAAERAAPA